MFSERPFFWHMHAHVHCRTCLRHTCTHTWSNATVETRFFFPLLPLLSPAICDTSHEMLRSISTFRNTKNTKSFTQGRHDHQEYVSTRVLPQRNSKQRDFRRHIFGKKCTTRFEYRETIAVHEKQQVINRQDSLDLSFWSFFMHRGIFRKTA